MYRTERSDNEEYIEGMLYNCISYFFYNFHCTIVLHQRIICVHTCSYKNSRTQGKRQLLDYMFLATIYMFHRLEPQISWVPELYPAVELLSTVYQEQKSVDHHKHTLENGNELLFFLSFNSLT